MSSEGSIDVYSGVSYANPNCNVSVPSLADIAIAGSIGPAPPRAPAARPAGMAAARVISRVTPGLLNFARSEHFGFV